MTLVASTDAALYEPDTGLLTLAAVLIGVWYLTLFVITAIRWPKMPRPAAPTSELGAEPPAVANLLCNGWSVTESAVPATLLDLAARNFLSIEDRGDQQLVCRLRRRVPSDPLEGYEKQVLDHLQKLSRSGDVPAGALTTGPHDRSRLWWKEFKRSVRDDAKKRGVARDLWPARLTLAMIALGAPIVFVVMAAQGFKPEEEVHVTPFLSAVTIAIWGGIAPLAWLTGTSRLRDTSHGRKVAARWLAVRESLQTLPSFPDLPANAVPSWERHLAYAAALGVAGRAVKNLPFGAEHDRVAWTDYGGAWKQVSVRYPVFRSGWGLHPGRALLSGIVGLAFAAAAMSFVSSLGIFELYPWGLLIGGTFLAVFGALAVSFFVGVVRALFDLGARPITVEGEVIRTRVRSTGSGDDQSRQKYFVAVYTGEGESVDAWRVDKKLYPSFVQGQEVTVTVTPKLGYVRLP